MGNKSNKFALLYILHWSATSASELEMYAEHSYMTMTASHFNHKIIFINEGNKIKNCRQETKEHLSKEQGKLHTLCKMPTRKTLRTQKAAIMHKWTMSQPSATNIAPHHLRHRGHVIMLLPSWWIFYTMCKCLAVFCFFFLFLQAQYGSPSEQHTRDSISLCITKYILLVTHSFMNWTSG